MPGTRPGMTMRTEQPSSQRLEILDQRLAIIGRQRRSDDAFDRIFLVVLFPELVSAVRIAADRGIELKTVGEVITLVAEVDGIVFAVAEIERLWPLLDRGQQRVDARDRRVVEIGRGRPDAVERTHLVGQLAAKFVWHIAVDALALRLGQRRLRLSVFVQRTIVD